MARTVAELADLVDRNELCLILTRDVPEHLQEAVANHLEGKIEEWHYLPPPPPPKPAEKIRRWAMRIVAGQNTVADAGRMAALSQDEVGQLFDCIADLEDGIL